MRPLLYIKDWDFDWQEVYQVHRTDRTSQRDGRVDAVDYAIPLITCATLTSHPGVSPSDRQRRPRWATFGFRWCRATAAIAMPWRETISRKYVARPDIAGALKTIEGNPRDAWLHTDLGFLYLKNGQVVEAAAHLKEAVQLDPGSAFTHYQFGTVLLNQQKLDEAGVHFREALRLTPTSPKRTIISGWCGLRKVNSTRRPARTGAIRTNPDMPTRITTLVESSPHSRRLMRRSASIVRRCD